MFPTIVAGLDGSPESLTAAVWAADEALNRGLALRLVHVCAIDGVTSGPPADADTERRRGQWLLDDSAGRFSHTHPSLAVETEQLGGDVVAALCVSAEEAELLVLGSRALGRLAGYVAGSVSLGVLAHIRRPVVLVRARHPGPSPGAEPPPAEQRGDVIVGLDTAGSFGEVLAFALRAAERYDCTLQVIHTWSLPNLYGPDLAGRTSLLLAERTADENRSLDQALAPWTQKYPAVTVDRQCHQGRSAQVLVQASRNARLVVVGRKDRPPGPGGHIGPVVHAVLHHAMAPIAVIPHG